MSYEYVIDSYAWIEYFRGSEQGKSAKEYIESMDSVTSSITIAELYSPTKVFLLKNFCGFVNIQPH